MSSVHAKMNLEPVIDALANTGYGVFDDLIPENVLQEVRALAGDQQSSYWQDAGVGRGQDHLKDRQIRGDQIRWLSDGDAPLFWSVMDNVRQTINRTLFMGLESFEGHCAHYAPNGHYEKHLDAFRGKSNRRLSIVLYLNPTWRSENGGQLRMFCPQNHQRTVVEVDPTWGRWVVFLSEKVPHEVLPAKANRYSVAGWFRGAEIY